MESFFTIELQGLRFFAEHGMYPEEMQVGNEFEVDVRITTGAPAHTVSSLDQTVNYAEVYHIISQEFPRHRKLLETLAMEMADRIMESFSNAQSVEIRVRKMTPPITGFTGSVGITYHRQIR